MSPSPEVESWLKPVTYACDLKQKTGIEDEMHLVGAKRAELEGRSQPFLVGVNVHQIRLLADCAMRSKFTAVQIIFRKGETGNRFYLIEDRSPVRRASV